MPLNDRIDFDVITDWIQPGEKVLDLGCDDGQLLAHLIDARGICGYGVEKDPARVIDCIQRGINVLQIDLEGGLNDFDDQFFDHVIMSLSLQAIQNTVGILHEMLRVGREAIVSFPNFAYWRHRQSIINGRMPVSDSLPYQWFDTPNVRFFTIADFETLCADNGITIRELRAFDDNQPITEEPNFLASLAICRLTK
ncbi:MAG: methionine biosynthesis protein MetW [Rhodocyclaceae bacterium]|nr:methionine biosynthesis protein MetW [Rhodocyclaceae bacterium]